MPDITALDFINVGKAGTFADSGKHNTTPQQVDDIFKHLAEKDVENLVIYFHGGLVSEKDGMAAASVMLNQFTKTEEKRHTVSFVWETGPKEVIMQNMGSLLEKSKTGFFQEVLKFVIKLAGKHLGFEDTKGGTGQYLDDSTIEAEKQKQAPFEELDRATGSKGGNAMLDDVNETTLLAKLEIESKNLIKTEGSVELKTTTTADDPDLTPELAVNIDPDRRGSWLAIIKVVALIAFNVLKRYRNKTQHDFYPTVIEETFRKLYVGGIGTWGWSSIKNKAEAMFTKNDGLPTGDGLHAGTYFIETLQKHHAERAVAGKKFSIQLVGHSAGSIVICVLLKTVMERYKDLRFSTVFFLAPACRTDMFLSHCVPAKEAGYFKKFKMFTMKEENEKKDHCIPHVYTHSLLYLVSGLFEVDAGNEKDIDAKILGLAEQFTAKGRYEAFPELQQLKSFLASQQVILSDDNINADLGLRCNALKHADFDNDPVTLTAILNSLS